MKQGKVWLVGAGPYDSGLMTLKGKRILEQAEVVVYDRLVGHGILAMIPPDAKTIDVGKASGKHTLPQAEINEVLKQYALAGKRVVRLKGGDPFLFGRGGEELELLREADIPFEVVPGVTSAVAVPAYAGIPVTHRDYVSSLHVITGHKKKGQDLEVDFEALKKAGGTYVFLMGLSALPHICQGFLSVGMSKDMPAAVLERGTSAKQRKVIGTIETLAVKAREAEIKSPGLIIIGEVCQLGEKFDWYEQQPLAGCKVVVTRPKHLISSMAAKLRDKGAEVVELPAISLESLISEEAFADQMKQIDRFDWLVFTSPSGVQIYFDAMQKIRFDIRKLMHLKIAVIGRGTARELEKRGIFADCMPERFDAGELGKALAERCHTGERIFIARAKQGSPRLLEELNKTAGLDILDYPLYDTIYKYPDIYKKSELEDGNIDCAIFTSASTVRGFVEGIKDLKINPIKSICIGRQTAEEALKYGMTVFTAKQATIDSVVDAVEEYYSNNR